MTERQMIMARAPLRLGLVGGGTDLPAYFRDTPKELRQNRPGAVVSAAIDAYITIIVNPKFEHDPDKVRVSYSKTEIVPDVDAVQHPSVKAALKLLRLDDEPIEIVSISDIPSKGTGLGSSSTFLVALLHALHVYKHEHAGPRKLAEEAVYIERDVLHESSGYQDQFMAAYGGMQYMQFNSDSTVPVEPISMTSGDKKQMRSHMLLLYTGKQRSATGILKSQADSVSAHIETYNAMSDLAGEMFRELSSGKWARTGDLLEKNWQLKRTLSDGISDPVIDRHHDVAHQNGATGFKIIGAGGGGFELIWAPPEKHADIIAALPELKPTKFDFSPYGSEIKYTGD